MELTEIASLEVWKELENEICKRSGLNASVFDMKGTRITGSENWVNRLCPIIKNNSKGQTFICSLAHQNIVAQVQKSQKAVIEECDAGMVKLAVPIIMENQMVGVVGGCGLLLEGGEVDTFLIQKTIGGEEKLLIELAEEVGVTTEDSLKDLSDYIEYQLVTIKKGSHLKIPN